MAAPKRRRGGIDTASAIAYIETWQSRMPLFNASSGDTRGRFHWIESGSQRGHGHGRVEADAMVVAFSRFADSGDWCTMGVHMIFGLKIRIPGIESVNYPERPLITQIHSWHRRFYFYLAESY